MTLPQPAGFAALSPDGRTLVASSGHALYVFEWRSGKLRYPPIQLGGSPMDLWLTADGRSVVGVVMGGRSGGARDQQMRKLIAAYMPKASRRAMSTCGPIVWSGNGLNWCRAG